MTTKSGPNPESKPANRHTLSRRRALQLAGTSAAAGLAALLWPRTRETQGSHVGDASSRRVGDALPTVLSQRQAPAGSPNIIFILGDNHNAATMGCAGHPFLAEFIDINRTYDVATSNPEEHLNRALMLRHTTPGCPVAFDFHTYLENLDAYFRTARENGCAVQIGNILGTRQDLAASWEPADEAYYETLRRELKRA